MVTRTGWGVLDACARAWCVWLHALEIPRLVFIPDVEDASELFLTGRDPERLDVLLKIGACDVALIPAVPVAKELDQPQVTLFEGDLPEWRPEG